MTTEVIVLKGRVQKNLEAILKHNVSVETIGDGKRKQVVFFDCETEKRMKCTLLHNCLISNIRKHD
jgi:hypothetical protein